MTMQITSEIMGAAIAEYNAVSSGDYLANSYAMRRALEAAFALAVADAPVAGDASLRTNAGDAEFGSCPHCGKILGRIGENGV